MPFSFPYIPALTMPTLMFANPYVSTLFPVLVGGLLGANIPNPSYTSRIDPPFRPPDLVFPLVWAPLYALMGYSSHLAYRTLNSTADGSFTLYTVQLLLNVAFLPLYSALGERLLGLLDMLLLDGCVVWLISEWASLGSGEDKVAVLGLSLGKPAWGLVPYVVWLVFATYLAVAYGWLNGWRNIDRGRWIIGKDGGKEKVN